MTEETLSDKIHRNSYEDTPDLDSLIDVKDVKDFIKKLKEELKLLHDNEDSIFGSDEYIFLKEVIDKLAGKELT